MAKLLPSALVGDIRGAVGGFVFSKNRSGPYARTKVSPVQPRTIRQMTVRADFSEISQAWRNLTAAQRGVWNDWSANHPIVDVFGHSQILSGNAAFMRVNADLVNLGIAITSAPLSDPTTPPPAAVSVAAVGATGVVTVTLAAAPDLTSIYGIWTTRGLSPGVAFVDSAFRFAAAPAIPTPPVVTIPVTPTTLNPLLSFSADQKIGVIVARYSDDGAFIDSTLLTAIAS